MIKVDAIELNDKGEVIAMKGKAYKSTYGYEDYKFSRYTLKVMKWAELNIEYCGG